MFQNRYRVINMHKLQVIFKALRHKDTKTTFINFPIKVRKRLKGTFRQDYIMPDQQVPMECKVKRCTLIDFQIIFFNWGLKHSVWDPGTFHWWHLENGSTTKSRFYEGCITSQRKLKLVNPFICYMIPTFYKYVINTAKILYQKLEKKNNPRKETARPQS